MKLKLNRIGGDASPGHGPDPEYYVLGDGHVGASLSRQLQTAGHAVTLIDETLDLSDVRTVRGDPRDLQVLTDAGLSATSTVVVALSRDRQNLLVAQLVRTHFDAADVFVLVHDPDRCDLFTDLGHAPICTTTILADAVAETVETATRTLEHAQ